MSELVKDLLGLVLGITIYLLTFVAERKLNEWVEKHIKDDDE